VLRDGLLAHFVRALLTQCDEYFVEFLHERGIVDPAKLGLEVVVRKVVGVREFDGVGRDFVGLVVVLVFALPNALPKIQDFVLMIILIRGTSRGKRVALAINTHERPLDPRGCPGINRSVTSAGGAAQVVGGQGGLAIGAPVPTLEEYNETTARVREVGRLELRNLCVVHLDLCHANFWYGQRSCDEIDSHAERSFDGVSVVVHRLLGLGLGPTPAGTSRDFFVVQISRLRQHSQRVVGPGSATKGGK